MEFDKKLENRILWMSVFSFLGPPIGWMFLIIVSEILDLSGILKIMTNPFFYIYIAIFLGYSIFSQFRMFRKIKEYRDNEMVKELNLLIKYIPRNYLVFTATYGFLGPPAVLLGLGFPNDIFIICWILGPIVISTFSIPFFNKYYSLVSEYLKIVPLNKGSFLSIRTRLNFSMVYLVVGALMMLTIVYFSTFYMHLQGNEITMNTLIFKLVMFLVIGVSIVGIPLFNVSAELRKDILYVGDYLQDFREGKLGKDMSIHQRDEIGFLMDDARKLSFHFNRLIGDIKKDAENISMLGNEIKLASQDIARGGESQLRSANEIGENLKQILDDTITNTKNSSDLNTNAVNMQEEIKVGQDEINTLNETLETIALKLNNLDEITRQTNLLALNAAVEAANAGEYGSGFAVVAGEVRKLADRSKGVAKEIQKMTEEIVKLAESSKVKFNSFAGVAESNAQLCSMILHASGKQKGRIEEINDRMDQFNLAMTNLADHGEKMDQSALSLQKISNQIKGLSDYFDTNHK